MPFHCREKAIFIGVIWTFATQIAYMHPAKFNDGKFKTEHVFINPLRNSGIDSQPGRPIKQPC
jgi:hypothetical protein